MPTVQHTSSLRVFILVALLREHLISLLEADPRVKAGAGPLWLEELLSKMSVTLCTRYSSLKKIFIVKYHQKCNQ